MEKLMKIGFFGLGTVGTQLLSLILAAKEDIRQKYSINFEIGPILVRDITKTRTIDTTKLLLTTHAEDIINDESISVCIECMGGSGTEETRSILLKALAAKKHVILSSKKCVAKYSEEIFEAARKNHCQVRIEATVGGGIPIFRTLQSLAKGEEILSIYGILNATSNYILTLCNEKKLSYEEALKNAIEKGYAENDPAEDINGWDAAYKLNILMKTAMGIRCDADALVPESIASVNPEEILEATQRDEVIKPIAYIKKKEDGCFTYYIGPCCIKKDSLLAGTSWNNNIIFTEGSVSGIRAFYGQGAGSGPTASAMFDDLIDILNHTFYYPDTRHCLKLRKDRNFKML